MNEASAAIVAQLAAEGQEASIRAGDILKLALALLTGLLSIVSAQSPPPPKGPALGCDTPESHQWDFWVGKWEVHPRGSDNIIAHSLIEKKYTGCAVRESWMPVGHEIEGGGGSLSVYDDRLKLWRQTWVDSAGSRVQLDGNFANGVMKITGVWPNFAGPGKDALVTMMYELQTDGDVRQWAESSSDGGKRWKMSFDFIYRRVPRFPHFK